MGDFGDDNGSKNDNNKDAEVTWDEFVPSLDSHSTSKPWKEDSDPFFGSDGERNGWKEDFHSTDLTSKEVDLEVPVKAPTSEPKGSEAESIEEGRRDGKGGSPRASAEARMATDMQHNSRKRARVRGHGRRGHRSLHGLSARYGRGEGPEALTSRG